ncbi:MAG: exodeoxyribonuclease V subunit beta [Desulfuromonadales bacterium]|nr:exodeoxyribonuclease V subunit beta [Desulfuromonadales bacterium]
MLIEASAGTGKTFTIAGIYLRLILEQNIKVDEILVVTFTDAATMELRDRIRKRLREGLIALQQGESNDPFLQELFRKKLPDDAEFRISQAIASFDQAAIFTIHGFCQRMLAESCFENGSLFNVELKKDQSIILQEIAEDYWRLKLYNSSPIFSEQVINKKFTLSALQNIGKSYNIVRTSKIIPDLPPDQTDFDQWFTALKYDFLNYILNELDKRKKENNIRFFDDLLIDLHSALDNKGDGEALARQLALKFKAALIDEFQDTDSVQYGIFDRIFPVNGPSRLIFVGDPKQAIYSFRGADIFSYMAASLSCEKVYTLSENWRSTERLVEGINAIFNVEYPDFAPFVFQEIKYIPVDSALNEQRAICQSGKSDISPLKIWFVPRDSSGKPLNKGDAYKYLSEGVGDEIANLLNLADEGLLEIDRNKVSPSDIAVLVRTNEQGRIIRKALTTRNIPSTISRGGDVFKSDEAKEILWMLCAIAEPGNDTLIRRGVTTGLWGMNGNSLTENLNNNSWEETLSQLYGLHKVWNSSGIIAMFASLFSKRNVRERSLALSGGEGERRLTNILHLVELLHQAAIEEQFGMDSLVSWFSEQLEESQIEEAEMRLETDDQAVKIVTIHKSKGLEYPIVFAPFLWSETSDKNLDKNGILFFHDEYRKSIVDLGSENIESNRKIASVEKLSESARLVYVALTRAASRCYFVWGGFRDGEKSALFHLLHPESKGDFPSDEKMLYDLERLSEASNSAISVELFKRADKVKVNRSYELEFKIACREFKGEIEENWRVTSFSGLSRNVADKVTELPDRDESSVSVDSENRESQTDHNMLPKGIATGIMLHEIFEKLDFTASDRNIMEQTVSDTLEKNMFEKKWQSSVLDIIDKTLNTKLSDGIFSFRLSDIPLSQRLTEMEFFLPLDYISSSKFSDLIRKWDKSIPTEIVETVQNLNFKVIKGAIHGFIDLVFIHQDKYYIVDWKSNYISSAPSEYSQEKLAKDMVKHSYPLQYLLYTVALNNYLKSRIPGYSYEKHFGGVFYIFLRGVGLDKENSGVYYDRPTSRLIQGVSDLLTGDISNA